MSIFEQMHPAPCTLQQYRAGVSHYFAYGGEPIDTPATHQSHPAVERDDLQFVPLGSHVLIWTTTGSPARVEHMALPRYPGPTRLATQTSAPLL